MYFASICTMQNYKSEVILYILIQNKADYLIASAIDSLQLNRRLWGRYGLNSSRI